MKVRLAVAAFLSAIVVAGGAQARAPDWRTCSVQICSNGQCEGPNANLIVVAPADFADPGFGGEAVMMQQLEALSERLYPAAAGWTRDTLCARSIDEGRAMENAKALIALAKTPPAVNEIKIANPFDVWKYTPVSTTASAAPVTGSGGTRAVVTPPVAEPVRSSGGAGGPMHFLLYVGLREPIGGINANCFSNIITVPAPEGYRGESPSLRNALPVIKSYFPAFLAECSKRGTVYGSVVYMTDDISPSQALIKMNATIGEWNGYRFPQVYVPN